MANTEEIMNSAAALGRLLSTHPAVRAYREMAGQLELDVGARTLLEQFEGAYETVAMKEASMQPVEIAEKQKLKSLEQSVAIHPVLKKLMAAQFEYTDLMRKMQEAMNNGSAMAAEHESGESASKPQSAASKLII